MNCLELKKNSFGEVKYLYKSLLVKIMTPSVSIQIEKLSSEKLLMLYLFLIETKKAQFDCYLKSVIKSINR